MSRTVNTRDEQSVRRQGEPTSATSGNSPARPDSVCVRFDEFELDEANARLVRCGNPIALEPTPFAVLCALVRQRGMLITNDALLDAVWGHRFVSKSVLKTAIGKLRTAFADDPRQPRYIETVSRRGYRFIGVARAMPAAQSTGASVSLAGTLQAPSITGRVDALARLRAAWDLACAGTRMVVWVAGDPGIGKTTVIDHFVSSLGNVASARGQCVEQYGAGEPYLPILEALASLCRSDATLATMLREIAPTWLLQLPWLSTPAERDALRQELAGVGQDRMLREMGELFDRYTEQRPLLLVIEDLHWSDHATIQFIDHIARRRGKGRLMCLASVRPAEIILHNHPFKALRNELRLHGLCEEIALDPFSEQEVAEYVAQRAPSFAASESFVHALQERTDGLPLLVNHVMNDLIARRALGGGDASAPLRLERIAIPENLAGIIDQYVARLTNEQRVVLEAAAVCGAEVRVSTVAAVLERDAASVAAICDELARGHLWLSRSLAEDETNPSSVQYSFGHALFRQVLYERIGPLARAELHCKVGAALERERVAGVPVSPAELAMHVEHCSEPMAALRHYADAAESALLHFSPTEAMSLSERGLTLLDRAERSRARDALEISLATLHGVSAVHLLGITSIAAKAAFCRAHALLAGVPQHPMHGLLSHELGFALCLRAEHAEALALAEQTEELSRAGQDPVLLLAVCVVRAQVHFIRGQPRIAREWAERGLAASESLDEAASNMTSVADPRVTLLGLLAIQLLHLGLVQQARARLQDARTRARRLAQPMAQCVAIWFDALVEVRLGNAERVAFLAREMQAIVDEFAFAQGRAYGIFGGWAQARMADPRGGYRLIREAYEENVRLGMRSGSSEDVGYAAQALLLAGDWRAAQQQLDEALQISNTLGERVYLPQLFLIEAAIADARGEAAAARASIGRAIAEAREQQAPWLQLEALLALCERNDAGPEDRRALAALLDQLPEAVDTTAVAKARALLANTMAA